MRRYYYALFAILALSIVLKWRFFCGLVQADDFSYGVYSYTMFRGIWPWNGEMDFRILRFGLMLPVSLIFGILPPNEVTAVLFPAAASLGTIVLVFLIGRRLYGPNAGIIGAFVFATFPGEVLYGTMLLPDIVVPFYLGLAVMLFLFAEEDKGHKGKLYYLLAGFCIFAAFVTRENSYYFFLFFLPYAFSAQRWRRGLYLIGAGFIVPVIALYGVYYLKNGDFLYNVHLAMEARDAQIASGYIPANAVNLFTQFKYMFPVFIQGGGMLSGTFGFTFYLGLPCLVYTVLRALKRKDRSGLLVPWWFLIVYLFLEFGTLSFSHYQVMKKLPRFLLTLTPAMALGFGVTVNDALGLGARTIKRWKDFRIRWLTGIPALAVMVVLLYTSFGVAVAQRDAHRANMEPFRWAYYTVLKNHPPKPVYHTGGWWNNKLSFYYLPDVRFADMNGRRSPMLRDLKAVEKPSELAGSYVIIDRSHFTGQNDLRIRLSYDDFGFYVLLPPKEWSLLGSGYDVEIYEVPEGWDYTQLSGEAAIRSLLDLSLRMRDPMRFLYCLHPAFVRTLDQNSFFALFNKLIGMSESDRSAWLDRAVQVENYEGKWRVVFKE